MDITFLIEHLPTLLRATRVTVELTVATLVLSTLLALPLAVIGIEKTSRVSRWLNVYALLMRSVPTLIVLFFLYFGLAEVGLVLPAFATALLGLTMSATAYNLAIFRSGLMSVPRGQIEAARALGIPDWRIWTFIVYPQAMPVLLPIYLSNATLVLKGTSVASIITIPELTATANEIVSLTYRPFEILLGSAAIYVALGGLLSLASRYAERTWRTR
ncbi:amino acid ABC transporter membrane protein 1 (PAAT family) [Rhizobium sp. PP-CC-3A-592]|nr:amino acid ABC transporter membrane protein 1 (PAAT family) [Rhizobium sp. PP-CC-3A-592]